ncbi:nuclease-related domain-containing protein [Gracilibacillus oryzae]|uniref:nuclease-related domain-containing protein n=1 Tax=Gracilibacillus oryzae TaxID=1672701 RepID=UPI001885DC0F|nr:nuclease-related domain-containing protein [Gracilibacillus oryzae]
MILKPPAKTPHLSYLEALQDRILHPDPDLSEAYGRELAGFLGESSLPYYIDLTSLPSHYDLYGLRLKHQENFFQIDSLLLFRNFLLILEAKHLKGKLLVNDADQLVQMKDSDQENVYDHPLLQAELQKQQLTSLLKQLGYPPIPIHTLASFTHKKAHLTFKHQDMIPSQQIPFRLKQISGQYRDSVMSMDQLLGLGKQLISLHRERKYEYVKDYRTIRRGVFCGKCKAVVMKRIYGSWICPKCREKDPLAHIPALIDFYYLFGSKVNNKSARWFLNVDSVYTSYRILNSLNLPASGKTKFRTYDLSSLIEKR